MRFICLILTVVATCCAQDEPAARDVSKNTDELSARQLASLFDKQWQEFVTKFRGESDTQARVKLLQSTSDKVNEILKPHLGEDTIRRVLPMMASAKMIDLERSFLGAMREQKQPKMKATVLLHFAQYLGNNRRVEDCEVTLRHLKGKYGDLRHGRSDFKTAADEALYFFKNLAVGCEAPPTTGMDADGEVFSLSDYQGKVVMLRFWGDWCPACRAMYPYEREIVQKYRNSSFALIGVNSDPKTTCKRAQDRKSLTWRSFWDGGKVGGPIARLYQVEDWPRIIIIDAKGVIRMNAKGLDEEYVTAMLDRLIDEAKEQDSVE